MPKVKTNQKVVVTTKHRGVFFGELVKNNAPEYVEIKNGKNCVYWEQSLHGFIGLASSGPNNKCRVGPSADLITLYDVTSIVVCTAQAIENWEKSIWS